MNMTYEQLAALNDQEIFDIVSKHLITQGRQASVKGQCVYRGNKDPNDPLRCAAGVLIPDHFYTPAFEACPYDDIKASLPVQSRLVGELQGVHDGGIAYETDPSDSSKTGLFYDDSFLEGTFGGLIVSREDQTFVIPELVRRLNLVAAVHGLKGIDDWTE